VGREIADKVGVATGGFKIDNCTFTTIIELPYGAYLPFHIDHNRLSSGGLFQKVKGMARQKSRYSQVLAWLV
jgi:hypothetical protein